METLQKITNYFKYITFICFLYASILLYPGLVKEKMGIICLIMVIIYSITTFIMIFVKNKDEEKNIFNNIVISILHFYFCFVTFRYRNTIGFQLTDTYFFPLNYFISSLAMLILTFNKLILWQNK